MKLLKILLGIAGAIVALTIFGKVRQKIAPAAPAPAASGPAAGARDPGLSPQGFFLLSRDDARNPTVTIMAPPGCPSHEAERARALAEALRAAGVPCELKPEIAFQFTDPADVARVNQYMARAPNPLVLVRGWAKGNPAESDVIAEYRSGR